MYVWTKKAELDWQKRHEYSSICPRKAGEIALYDNEPLMSGSILDAYIERGLVVQTVVRSDGEVAERRWKVLQRYFGQAERPMIKDIAEEVGFKDAGGLTKWVRAHGNEMVMLYGKLPRPKKLRYSGLSESWQKVMK